MPETVNEMARPISSRRAYISGLSTKVGGKQISQKKHQQNNLKKKKKLSFLQYKKNNNFDLMLIDSAPHSSIMFD